MAESKVSVYSISWGWLMAMVSAMTGILQLNPVTGISNVELPSVGGQAVFLSVTFM